MNDRIILNREKDAKTCCFIGYGDAPEWVRPLLASSIKWHILEYGVTNFLVGNYGNFDCMACAVVAAMKDDYPYIRLYLMLAYPPKPGQTANQECVDELVYPEGLKKVFNRAAIPCLNRMMVDASDYAIAYVCHTSSGAYRTMQYAWGRKRRGEMRITNLANI